MHPSSNSIPIFYMCFIQVLTIYFFLQRDEAHLLYIELDPKNKPFTLMHCYLKFSEYPKRETREQEVSQKKKRSEERRVGKEC